MSDSFYTLLGVAADATPAEIEAAYRAREAALQAQPDELSLLRFAYDTLRQPAQRAGYDRRLAQRTVAAPAPPPHAMEWPAETAPPPRSRRLNWIVLAAVAAAAYFWLQRAPAKAPQPAPPPVVAASRPAASEAPRNEERAPEPAATPAPAEAPPAPVIREATAADMVLSQREQPTRGAKGPGFDAQYLAWSVFTIRQRRLSGSGVLIAPDRILTNCHVLAGGATNGLVAIHAATGQSFRVEKYARLDGEDACLLLAPGAGSDTIEWGSSAALRAGDTVHAFGHPGGSSEVVWSEGAFRMRVERGGETFLLSDTYCRPGSSGGPLLDNEGRLVGVVTAVQRFKAKGGDPAYGACVSITEATARTLLAKPLFPIALAPAQYVPNY